MTATDLTLLKRWQRRRDPEAFQQLVHRHANMVFATCRRVLGNAADAEEVAQDCFLSLADAADKPARSLGGWLHAMAASRARDRIRGDTRRRQREQRYAAEHAGEASPEPNDAAEVLDEALSALPETLREPLVVHFLEGRTHAETAKRLGVSRPTVTRRINAGLARLREELRTRNVVIAAGALSTLLTTEAAHAAPPTLIASLGSVALDATKYTAAAGGFSYAISGAAVVAIVLGVATVVGIALPRAIQSKTPAAQETVAVVPEPRLPEQQPSPQQDAQPETAAATVRVDPPAEPPVGARVHGVVRDLDGNPMAEAVVKVFAARGAFNARGRSETGDDGRYSIDGIPPTNLLYVHASTNEPRLLSPPLEIGEVAAGETYEADLALHAASISGVVVDGKGRPIANADVWTMAEDELPAHGLPIVTTDAAGQFVAEGLFAGKHEMRVRTDEQQPFRTSTHVTLAAAEHRAGLRLVHDVAGENWVWGNIVDSAGDPVADVHVNALDVLSNKSTFDVTDTDGAYLIAVDSDGPFNIQTRHREYGTALEHHIYPGTGPLVIALRSRSDVMGRVVNRKTGAPVERFQVQTLVPVTEEADTLYTHEWTDFTDPNGAFTLANIEPGQHTIRVRAPGYAESGQEAYVYAERATTGVKVALDRARDIAGLVVDGAGDPVAGARVFAGPLPANYRSGTSAVHDINLSGSNGEFRIENAAENLDTVSAAHPNFPPVTQPAGSNLDAIRIVLHQGGSVAGIVTVDGHPAAEARVFALHNIETQPVMVARATSAADGSFELDNVGPGPTPIFAGVTLGPNLVQHSMYRTVNIVDDEATPAEMAFITGNSGIEGHVTYEGRPVASAMVVAAKALSQSNWDTDMVEATTDVNGAFRIDGVLPGAYEVKAFIPRLKQRLQPPPQTVTIHDGETGQVDFAH